jgi:phenylacetate-CoA ligase
MTTARRVLDTAAIGLRAGVERTVPFWPRPWIEAMQRRRLRAIVRHAYDTVPFYRVAMDERGLRPADFRTVADLERLPIIDGEMLRRDVTRFCSTAYDDRTREIRYSTGSISGVEKVLYWDKPTLLAKLAHAERDRAVLNRLVGKPWGQRQLYILPESSASLKLRRLWDGRLVVPRALAERRTIESHLPFDAVADEIDAFRPDVIYSYGAYADVFIRTLVDRRRTIARPRVWMYGGDMLSAGGRRLIEERLGCRVYSTYQANEAGRIGFQCERCEGFHLNVDLCAVRLVDEAGQPVAPGETGEVVISNLHNRAMVLLNYRLEDRGAFDPAPCPCGRSLPLLRSLDGRVTDVVQRPDGQPMSGYVIEGYLDTPLQALATQLVGRGPGRIEYLIVPMTGVDREAFREQLIAEVRGLMGPEMGVTVTFVEELPTTRHGKRLKVRPLAEAASAGSISERPGSRP